MGNLWEIEGQRRSRSISRLTRLSASFGPLGSTRTKDQGPREKKPEDDVGLEFFEQFCVERREGQVSVVSGRRFLIPHVLCICSNWCW